jgi:hypothetical protein
MSPPSDRKTKPDNPRATPGIPGVPIPPRIVEADGTRGRDSRADPPSEHPPPRTEVEIADDDPAVQSMRAPRGRAAKTAAIIGAIGASLAGLVPILSATLESCQRRQEAEAQEAAQRAKALPELAARVTALELEVRRLQTIDPAQLELMRTQLADAAKRLSDAERDITRLYRARPSRAPE